jgi:DNA-binding CsgD family transcriptional regulator
VSSVDSVASEKLHRFHFNVYNAMELTLPKVYQVIVVIIIFTLSFTNQGIMKIDKNKPTRPLKTYMVGQYKFTECQMRVFALSTLGLQRKQMAYVLSLTEAGIGSHIDRIFNKLGIRGITLIAMWANNSGFDEKGNYKGEYLFDNYTQLPWEPK